MIWHEVTFVYYKDGSRQAWRSGAEITEGSENCDRPQSKRKHQKGKSIYIEYYPDERTADQAVEDFKKAVTT